MKKNHRNHKRSRIYSLKLPVLFLAILINLSCKKEISSSVEQQNEIKIVDGRLSFQSTQSFEKLMTTLSQDRVENANDLVTTLTGLSNFVSLSEFVAKGEEVKFIRVQSSAKSFNQQLKLANSSGVISFAETGAGMDTDMLTTLDELVPDPYFASVLNSDMEVMVEDDIYKVTPYGTFVVDQQHYNQLQEMLDNTLYDGTIDPNESFYSNQIGDRLYQVAPGIKLVDSYEVTAAEANDVLNIQYYPVVNNPVYQYTPSPDAWIYNNLPTIQYGGKTWAGKVLQSIIGREEVYTENFEAKRRVKVNFYNIYWGVYSAIGVSVQLQKKNWIGWSSTEAPELRMGWDAIEYSIGQPATPPPAPANATPSRFIDADELPNLTKKYITINLLDKQFSLDLHSNLQKGISKIHEMLPSIPGLKPNKDSDKNYAFKVWANNAKTAASVVLDRDEVIGYNVDKLSKVFDWAVGIKASWNFESSPSFDKSPLKFEMKRASVFGVAKYGTQWKGARIVLGE